MGWEDFVAGSKHGGVAKGWEQLATSFDLCLLECFPHCPWKALFWLEKLY